LPAYLYWSAFDFHLQENVLYYAIVVPATVVFIALAYHNVYKVKRIKLISIRSGKSHKKLGLSREDLESLTVDLATKESLTYSLWFNNLIYSLVFSFLAFYALQSLPTNYNYIFSSVIAGALQWQLSTA